MATTATAAGPSASADLAEAHSRLLADKTLQFDFLLREPPQPPPEIPWLARLIEALAPFLMFIFWGGLALAVVLIVVFFAREFLKTRWQGRAKAVKLSGPSAEAWRPTEAQARLLLAEFDRLAAEGRLAEAAHYLLLHCIQDVEDHRPRSIRPSLTSRDIAAMDGLPADARAAFGRIATVVERSLFGGRPANVQDLTECRQAYESFAFGGRWA